MQASKVFLVKFIAITAISIVILSFSYNVDIFSVFLISVVLSLISYFIGDKFILPRTNNRLATIADFGLCFLLLLFFLNLIIDNPNFSLVTASLLTAAGIAVCEYFVHRMIITNYANDNYESIQKSPKELREAYSTELSEELMKNQDKK